MVAVVARSESEVLLAERGAEGLFGGLWEPPMVESSSVEAARQDLSRLGIPARARLSEATVVRHVLTHRVMHVEVCQARPRRRWQLKQPNTGPYRRVAWCSSLEVPLSTLAAKVLRATVVAVVLGLVTVWWPRLSLAQEPKSTDDDTEESERATEADLAMYRKLNLEGGNYARVFVTAGGGKGIRFNNPYRLSEQLGDTSESLSATSAYFDLSLNAAFGEPNSLQHGGALHFAIGLQGVAQQALSASYLAVYRGPSPWMVYGRLGVSILTAPDANLGGELAVGLSYFFTGSLGLTTELVGNLFYGAGTYAVNVTTVPVLSLQGGIIADFEVLP
jgi:hypothetical protein